MDLLKVSPLLVPTNMDLTAFTGYLTVRDQQFQVEIHLDAPGSVAGAKLNCEWKLKHLLAGYHNLIQERLKHTPTLPALIVELTSIIERCLSSEPSCVQTQPPRAYYDHLIAEIEEVGWDRVVFIDSNFQELHLEVKDGRCRPHLLKIWFSPQHPAFPPKCVEQLPGPFKPAWSKTSTLRDVLTQFEHQIKVYQQFWDVMDEVDQKTWVLEPEKPTRNAVRRRIALGNNASLQIEVDPNHPRMFPECRLLGADHVINPLRKNLNKRLYKWDAEDTLLTNLQAVLQVTFPSPSNTSKEDLTANCGLCYSYCLEGQIPSQVCDDPRCGQPFHQACLYEWFRSLPCSRQSFNVVFGECPFCSKAIAVKMPSR